MLDWRYYRDRYGWSKAECAAVGLDVGTAAAEQDDRDELQHKPYELGRTLISLPEGAEP